MIYFAHGKHSQTFHIYDLYTGCPQKSGTLDFQYFDIKKYSIFLFHQIKHCLLKRMIPRSLKLVEYFDSMVISQNIVTVNFLFILVTVQSGIMAVMTYIHCCPEAHWIWSMQTKQRENLCTAIPAVNNSGRFNKICKWLFQKMVVESILSTKSNDLGIILFRRQCFIWWNQKMLYFWISK